MGARIDAFHTEFPALSPQSASLPTKLERRLALEGGTQAGAKAERAERRRWVGELRVLVIATSLPCLSLAKSTRRPAAFLHTIGLGQRAATIHSFRNCFSFCNPFVLSSLVVRLHFAASCCKNTGLMGYAFK